MNASAITLENYIGILNNIRALEGEQSVTINASPSRRRFEYKVFKEIIESELNDAERKIVVSLYLEGKTVLEISQELKISERTLFQLRRSAVEKIARSLDKYEQNQHLVFASTEELTLRYLSSKIIPYLDAIDGFQLVIDFFRGKPHDVIITSITQNSPVSVSLDGAADAIQLIKETIVPWRRKHSETMARLLEQEKQIDIEIKRAEILEKRAHAEKERIEASKQREEATKLKLENDRLNFELQKAKAQLAIDILARISHKLPEAEKAVYMVRLLTSIDALVFSELEIASK